LVSLPEADEAKAKADVEKREKAAALKAWSQKNGGGGIV
jgi:hypothetical protein